MTILCNALTLQDINAALLRLQRSMKNEQTSLDGKVTNIISGSSKANNNQYNDSFLREQISKINDLVKETVEKVNKLETSNKTLSEKVNKFSTLLANINFTYDPETRVVIFTGSDGKQHQWTITDTTYTFSFDTDSQTLTIHNDLDVKLNPNYNPSDPDSPQYIPDNTNDFVQQIKGTTYTFTWENGSLTIHNNLSTTEHPIADVVIPFDDRYYTETEIDALILSITNRLDAIEAVIPEEATSSNKLADKAWVATAISISAATFRGTFNSLADLQAYAGPKDSNDYAFVKTSTGYDQYTYVVSGSSGSWTYEFSLETLAGTLSVEVDTCDHMVYPTGTRLTSGCDSFTTLCGAPLSISFNPSNGTMYACCFYGRAKNVGDYNSPSEDLFIGYRGSGLCDGDVLSLAGFTRRDNNGCVSIKDIGWPTFCKCVLCCVGATSDFFGLNNPSLCCVAQGSDLIKYKDIYCGQITNVGYRSHLGLMTRSNPGASTGWDCNWIGFYAGSNDNFVPGCGCDGACFLFNRQGKFCSNRTMSISKSWLSVYGCLPSWTIVDLTGASYCDACVYPVIFSMMPGSVDGTQAAGMVNVCISNLLNTNKPSWASHNSGFTLTLDLWDMPSAWGGSSRRTYAKVYNAAYLCQDADCSVGYSQMTNSSTGVLWLRGGACWRVWNSVGNSFTPVCTSCTINSQTVSPVAYGTQPKINAAIAGTSIEQVLKSMQTYQCAATANQNRNLLFTDSTASGFEYQYFSGSCPLTFNPATGMLCVGKVYRHVNVCALPNGNNSPRYVLICYDNQSIMGGNSASERADFDLSFFTCSLHYNTQATTNYACGPSYNTICFSTCPYTCTNCNCFWLMYKAYWNPVICSAYKFEVICCQSTAPTGVTFCNFTNITSALTVTPKCDNTWYCVVGLDSNGKPVTADTSKPTLFFNPSSQQAALCSLVVNPANNSYCQGIRLNRSTGNDPWTTLLIGDCYGTYSGNCDGIWVGRHHSNEDNQKLFFTWGCSKPTNNCGYMYFPTKCQGACWCGNVCGLSSCAYYHYMDNYTANANRNVMLSCAGSGAYLTIGGSGACPLTFNPATGWLCTCYENLHTLCSDRVCTGFVYTKAASYCYNGTASSPIWIKIACIAPEPGPGCQNYNDFTFSWYGSGSTDSAIHVQWLPKNATCPIVYDSIKVDYSSLGAGSAGKGILGIGWTCGAAWSCYIDVWVKILPDTAGTNNYYGHLFRNKINGTRWNTLMTCTATAPTLNCFVCLQPNNDAKAYHWENSLSSKKSLLLGDCYCNWTWENDSASCLFYGLWEIPASGTINAGFVGNVMVNNTCVSTIKMNIQSFSSFSLEYANLIGENNIKPAILCTCDNKYYAGFMFCPGSSGIKAAFSGNVYLSCKFSEPKIFYSVSNNCWYSGIVGTNCPSKITVYGTEKVCAATTTCCFNHCINVMTCDGCGNFSANCYVNGSEDIWAIPVSKCLRNMSEVKVNCSLVIPRGHSYVIYEEGEIWLT